MSCCSESQEATVKEGAIGEVVISLLIQEFGPILAQMIIGLLTKTPAQAALGDTPVVPPSPPAPAPTPTPSPVVNIKTLIAALLSQTGPTLIAALVSELNASGDPTSKFVATVLQSAGPGLLQNLVTWLNTPAALAAIEKAMLKVG